MMMMACTAVSEAAVAIECTVIFFIPLYRDWLLKRRRRSEAHSSALQSSSLLGVSFVFWIEEKVTEK